MRLWRACLILLLLANTAGLALIYKKIDDLSKLFPFALLQDSIQVQSEISTQLSSIQSLLSQKSSPDSPTTVLGISELLPDKSSEQNASANHFVTTIKDSTKPVNAYKEQAVFSEVLGQLLPDYKYPYFAKIGNWYLIGLTGSVTGWVQAQEVTENL